MNDEPDLLDVVPWTYGYAHSWALRWLVTNPATRSPVMRLLVGEDRGPWELSQAAVGEHRVKGARADLAVWATDRAGTRVHLAVEVKVADAINAGQLAAYREGGFAPVLYVPGLTGLLYAPGGPLAEERWVTGGELAAALKAVSLPPIIGSYVQAVGAEARRMELARRFARDEVDDFPREGQARYEDVMDAAWLAEVVRALDARGAEDLVIRLLANDRGIYWQGCRRTLSAGADIYVDVLADLRTHFCVVALKVGGGDRDDRLAVYEAALEAGPPSEAGWSRGRKPTLNSGRVWTLNASELNADETATHTLEAGAYIERLAATADG